MSVESMYEAAMKWATEQHGDELRGNLPGLVALMCRVRDKSLEEAASLASAVATASQKESMQSEEKQDSQDWQHWADAAEDVAVRIRLLKGKP